MQFHRGRLIDHIHLRVADLEASKRFYRAVFIALGKPDVLREGPGHYYADELYVDQADDYVTRVHIAFQAPDRETVHAFHQAALDLPALRGRVAGPIGRQPRLRPGSADS